MVGPGEPGRYRDLDHFHRGGRAQGFNAFDSHPNDFLVDSAVQLQPKGPLQFVAREARGDHHVIHAQQGGWSNGQ